MSKQVTVYSSSGWMPCKAAKEFLSHHGISFTDRNVAEDSEALEELVTKTGRRATPVILIDDDAIVGFDRGKIERLLGLWRTAGKKLCVLDAVNRFRWLV